MVQPLLLTGKRFYVPSRIQIQILRSMAIVPLRLVRVIYQVIRMVTFMNWARIRN